MTLKWEKLGVPFTVSVNDADQTLQNIRAQMKGAGQFAWQAPDQAAQFCLTRKINLDEALKLGRCLNSERGKVRKSQHQSGYPQGAESSRMRRKPLGIRRSRRPMHRNFIPMVDSCRIRRRGAEAMEIFKEVAKRFPNGVFGYLAQARIKSAAGDFAGALSDAKQAQTAAPSEGAEAGNPGADRSTPGEAGHQQVTRAISDLGR